MLIHRAQFDAACEALAAVLKFEQPADAVLRRYFCDHSRLGSNDKGFIADAVFGVVRRKRFLDALVAGPAPRRLLLAYFARVAGANARELEAAVTPAEVAWFADIKARKTGALPLGVEADLPDWVVGGLRAQMSDDEILALGRALQQPAPLDLRVNTLRGDRDAVLRELAASGIPCTATPYSPVGIRARGHPAINRHPLFLNGTVEVQDEGSQLLACLVEPTRHDLVVDFCAGAGGKSLHLGALMRSRGRVYAFDVAAARLTRLKPRLKRSGLSNLHPQLIAGENDARIKRLAGKTDRVLVDAPCSGLGTLRRNPDLKWRQSPQSVIELRSKQTAILSAAARLLKSHGRLVYATCSLLAEENQEVVSQFLAAHPNFATVECSDILLRQRIPLDTGPFLQLLPHRHGTDGFFAAVLELRPQQPADTG
ncbi:MAG: RsmB/NOP family class I SAM-dependent RNA methyltransferase [Betaproteobacteria bacterium]|nr:RsmB/NOP family class I SAM-dependent RNA methyltransferase [Betaproteobacteria bacterium]